MTPRPTDRPLHRLLAGHYAAHRRARVLRESLRAAALVIAMLVLAIVAGLARPGGETWAWARLAVVGAGLVFAIARAIDRVRRASPRFDGFLEQVEQRFGEVRSWLRNAL